MKAGQSGSGFYILAAVICDIDACDSIRDALRPLREGKQPRLHWRDERAKRRNKIARAIAEMDFAAVVVVGAPMARSKQERGRRICMEALLPILVEADVDQVWLEARTASLNERDHRHIAALRGRRAIPQALQIDIEYPVLEPMLWIADVVAGVVGAARQGT